MGLWKDPSLMASTILYSSVPPTCIGCVPNMMLPKVVSFQWVFCAHVKRLLSEGTHLSEQHEHLDVGVVMVTLHVAEEGGAWIPVSADRDALVDAVRVHGDDVVELVRHAARARHVRHTEQNEQHNSGRIQTALVLSCVPVQVIVPCNVRRFPRHAWYVHVSPASAHQLHISQ